MRVNLFGGPGVGKSTLAATVYGKLQQQGCRAELVQEWIKTWAYQGRRAASFDYVYTFAKQLHAEYQLLQAGVDVIVTDSPIHLQCVYARQHARVAAASLSQLATAFEATYPSLNFLVRRSVPYTRDGRYETEADAKRVDRDIRLYLDTYGVAYTEIGPNDCDRVLELTCS